MFSNITLYRFQYTSLDNKDTNLLRANVDYFVTSCIVGNIESTVNAIKAISKTKHEDAMLRQIGQMLLGMCVACEEEFDGFNEFVEHYFDHIEFRKVGDNFASN